MSALIKDHEILEKYNIKSGIKSAIVSKREFDNEPVNNEKYLKIEIKTYDGKINTNFQGDKLPKEGSHCIYLLAIMIDSVFGIGKSYYSQVFLEECKYIVKEKR